VEASSAREAARLSCCGLERRVRGRTRWLGGWYLKRALARKGSEGKVGPHIRPLLHHQWAVRSRERNTSTSQLLIPAVILVVVLGGGTQMLTRHLVWIVAPDTIDLTARLSRLKRRYPGAGGSELAWIWQSI
jgi:hypothetical protein